MIISDRSNSLVKTDKLPITNLKFSRRWFFIQLLILSACGVKSISTNSQSLVLGVVSYHEGEKTINRFANFNRYLSAKTGGIVKLEPAFNENQALEQIRTHSWSLVFAAPGLAAIAISQNQYTPLLPLQGVSNLRSIFVVRNDSPIHQLKELQNQVVALSQPGSATGYFFPIYNLYGLTLAEIVLALTPKAVLELVAQGKASAGALSKEEFHSHSPQLSPTQFRILYTDPHDVPPGVVLVAPNIEDSLQQQIRQAMNEAPAILAQEVGYIPNGPLPDYRYMISVVKRVRATFPDEFERGATPLQLKPARIVDNISI